MSIENLDAMDTGGQPHLPIEIFELILFYNTKADNSRCARVCRAWAEIALDYLWADLRSFIPLLRVLPLTFVVNDSRKALIQISSVKALKPDDWKRFIFYAARVKTLVLGNGHWEPSPRTEIFLNLCPSSPLFPRLEDISLFLNGTHRGKPEDMDLFISYANVLLHEGVRKLRFGGSIFEGWDFETMERVLTEISTRCPNLRTVDGPPCTYTGNIQPVLLRFATSFNNVEKLTVPASGFSPTFFVSLGYLDNLRLLRSDPGRMSYPTGRTKGYRDICLEDDMFRSLRTLELHCSLKDISYIFERNPKLMPNLRELKVWKLLECNARDTNRLLGALATTRSYMEVIKIATRGHLNGPVADHITAAVLQPLSSFANLRVFGLKYSNSFNVTNEELSEILSKCPKLRKLRLRPVFPLDTHTSLTLAVLDTLAENNRELERIRIYFDVTKDIISKGTPRPFDNLEWLSIDHSLISLPPIVVSTYLSRILSTPETLDVHYPNIRQPNIRINSSMRMKKWNEVCYELKRIMGT